MATLFQVPQFFNTSGEPLAFGKLYWYEAGTSNPKNTWKDEAETSLHTNPIILTADGRPPTGAIFIRGSYKLICKNSDDTETIFTIDNINEYDSYDFTGLTASIADLNSTTTTAVSVSGNYNVTLGNRGKTLMADALSGVVNINLPTAATVGDTYKIGIKKIDDSVNTVAILPYGSQTIDNYTSFTLYDFNDYIELHCDGSNWKILGSLIRGSIKDISTTTTVDLGDNGLIFNCDLSSGAFTINLPACADVGRGFEIGFKKTDSSVNELNISANGSETIDGESNYFVRTKDHFVLLKTDGSNWYIVTESGGSTEFAPGDVKLSYKSSQPGWVLMNDGTIGDASSGATTRANADTKNLFITLWDHVSDAYCPVYNSVGNKVARGASALDDFNAHRRLRLPKTLGRSFLEVGSANPVYSFVIGQEYGEYVHQQSINQLAQHSHAYSYAYHVSLLCHAGGAGHVFDGYATYNTGNTGVSESFNVLHPISAIYYLIKL